jgi:hypothetical protein
VALHPHPKGIIQFVGGAFFGSFPTFYYRQFFSQLWAGGYSLIVLPFQFTFRHWPVASKLLREQVLVRERVSRLAQRAGHCSQIYGDPAHYFWLGHSLGGKYVALLEVLSRESPESQFPNPLSIQGQPSLLIAPVMGNTDSAIPLPWVAALLDQLGLGVVPTQQQLRSLIEKGQGLNLVALISFTGDSLAGSVTEPKGDETKSGGGDVLWLMEQLQRNPQSLLHQEVVGDHFTPLGISPCDGCPSFGVAGSSGGLAAATLQLLEKLDQRRKKV